MNRGRDVLKKFFDGLVFGLGFALSFILIAWLAAFLVPMLIRPEGGTASVGVSSHTPSINKEHGPAFHELPLEEQIRKSSVIALARFEPAPDGKMKAIFTEFLKLDPGTMFYYKKGDEYPSASYYPKEGMSHGDGLVVFFVGSPASMRMSMTYSGDRIHSLGDIPLELFRQKCDEN